MSSTILKPYSHNGQTINIQFTTDAFFNATAAAKPFGKTPKDWLRVNETQEYIEAIRRKCLLEQNQLVKVVNGAPGTGGGTWLHPKLGVYFARWLGADFAVWADEQIALILSGTYQAQSPKSTIAAQPPMHLALNRAMRTMGRHGNDAFIRLMAYEEIQIICGHLGLKCPPACLIGKPYDQLQMEV